MKEGRIQGVEGEVLSDGAASLEGVGDDDDADDDEKQKVKKLKRMKKDKRKTLIRHGKRRGRDDDGIISDKFE